jgi:hypothetical protein
MSELKELRDGLEIAEQTFAENERLREWQCKRIDQLTSELKDMDTRLKIAEGARMIANKKIKETNEMIGDSCGVRFLVQLSSQLGFDSYTGPSSILNKIKELQDTADNRLKAAQRAHERATILEGKEAKYTEEIERLKGQIAYRDDTIAAQGKVLGEIRQIVGCVTGESVIKAVQEQCTTTGEERAKLTKMATGIRNILNLKAGDCPLAAVEYLKAELNAAKLARDSFKVQAHDCAALIRNLRGDLGAPVGASLRDFVLDLKQRAEMNSLQIDREETTKAVNYLTQTSNAASIHNSVTLLGIRSATDCPQGVDTLHWVRGLMGEREQARALDRAVNTGESTFSRNMRSLLHADNLRYTQALNDIRKALRCPDGVHIADWASQVASKIAEVHSKTQ